MRLTFHGAAQEVTGSMHLLEVNGQRILLDCGLYQGRRGETYERNLKFPWEHNRSIVSCSAMRTSIIRASCPIW